MIRPLQPTSLAGDGAVYHLSALPRSSMITSLNGSGGSSKDHGDVTNEAVTCAFAATVART